MKNIFYNIKYLLVFFLFLKINKYIICKKKTWGYYKCKKYLSSLDIFCYKINKEGIFNFCEVWEAKDINALLKVQNLCLYHKYVLPLIYKYSNSTSKIDSIIDIDLLNISEYKSKKRGKIIIQKDKEIKQCLKYFEKFLELSSLDNIDFDEINSIFFDLKKKLNSSNFCIDFSIHLINELEKSLNSEKTTNNNINSEMEFTDYVNYKLANFIHEGLNETNKQTIEKNDDLESLICSDSEIKKKYDQDYENDLETYYLNSKKDCVEYGLKSSTEDIIVCLKYE